MIGNWELYGLDNAALDRELSLANMDASIVLCEQMVAGRLPKTFSHAKTIMSLCYHGVELFLKYAIRRKRGGEAPATHYLRKLERLYSDLYPSQRFSLEVPFIPAYLECTSEELQEYLTEEAKKPSEADQMLRYHMNQSGRQWDGAHGFEAEGYLTHLHALRARLAEIAMGIEKESAPCPAPQCPPSAGQPATDCTPDVEVST